MVLWKFSFREVLHRPGRALLSLQKDHAVRDYKLAAGEFFRDGEGVLLEAEFARGMGLGLNDEIKLLTRRGVWKTRVAGLLRARGAGSFYLGNLVFLPLKTAQRVFAASGRVDVIQLVADDSTSSDKLLAEVARRLPTGSHVDRPASRTRLVEQTLLASDLGLQMAASFAVLLATFIIRYTFLMNVAERRRQLAILRARGATRRQVSRLLIGESLTLGVLGTGLGIPVGLAGARLLILALNQLLLTSLPPLHSPPFAAGGPGRRGPRGLGRDSLGLHVGGLGQRVPGGRLGRPHGTSDRPALAGRRRRRRISHSSPAAGTGGRAGATAANL